MTRVEQKDSKNRLTSGFLFLQVDPDLQRMWQFLAWILMANLLDIPVRNFQSSCQPLPVGSDAFENVWVDEFRQVLVHDSFVFRLEGCRIPSDHNRSGDLSCVFGECDGQCTDGGLGSESLAPVLGLPHEGESSFCVCLGVVLIPGLERIFYEYKRKWAYLDHECESVLLEWLEVETQLVATLRHGNQIASKLQELMFSLQDLDIAGLGNESEMFLLLQGLVFLVIRHTEHTEITD